MLQIKQKRIVRTIIALNFYLLCGVILLLIGYRYVRIKSFLTVGVILLPFVIFGNLVVVLLRMKHHELKKGRKYAKLHTKIENSLIQALYDDGYYVKRNVLFKKWSV